MSNDSELLVGLSDDESEALADSMLAPSAQARLDKLLERNAENQLAVDEQAELDRLLARVDQLTILKTRARYTLRQQAGASGAGAFMSLPISGAGFATISPTAVPIVARQKI